MNTTQSYQVVDAEADSYGAYVTTTTSSVLTILTNVVALCPTRHSALIVSLPLHRPK